MMDIMDYIGDLWWIYWIYRGVLMDIMDYIGDL